MGYFINKKGEQSILPETPLGEKQLFYASIFNHRFDGADLPMPAIEIGVLDGETSAYFLNTFPDLYLWGIDPLIPDSMEQSLIGSYGKIMANVGENKKRFHFIQDYSFNVVGRFDDESIDFIFIDGDHTYDAVKQDYELYYPKIRKGGLIFFHDSRMNRGGAPFHVGSSKFVDELIAGNTGQLELIGEAFSLTCFRKL